MLRRGTLQHIYSSAISRLVQLLMYMGGILQKNVAHPEREKNLRFYYQANYYFRASETQ